MEEIVLAHSERWQKCADHPTEKNLLRLSILRTLAYSVHAQKSHLLATGNGGDFALLTHWEQKLEELRATPSLDGEILPLLSSPLNEMPKQKKSSPLAQPLTTFLESEKLERYDRQWDKAVAVLAYSLGWNFSSLTTGVPIAKIETWDLNFRDQLWPKGLVLFTKSADSSSSPVSLVSSGELWHGKWILALHPDFNPLEGPTQSPFSSSEWKLLFSKNRP